MKARESIKSYSSKLGEYTGYTVKKIKHICKTIGPRKAGTLQERKAQEYFAQELKTCCDEVKLEEFTLSPAAFMGWVQICVFLMIASSILFFFGQTIISGILSLISVIAVVGEFLLYKKTLDPFFPKKKSANVVAVRKAAGETKKRIVFSGHCDSSMEWRFTYYGGPKLLVPITALGLIGIVMGFVLNIIAILTGNINAPFEGTFLNVMKWVLIGWTPFMLINLLFYDRKRVVEGANDNLTGSAASVAVMKFLNDHDIRFENTEVCAVITGAEEAGLRGAKAFCKAHPEYKEIETAFVGLETFKDYEHMSIYCRDMTGLVKTDAKVCALLKEAAKIAGRDIPYKSVYFGSSDATAIQQGGIPAATLASMDPAPARYYHTRLDNHENLDPKTIENGIDIAIEAAFLFNSQGLKVSYD